MAPVKALTAWLAAGGHLRAHDDANTEVVGSEQTRVLCQPWWTSLVAILRCHQRWTPWRSRLASILGAMASMSILVPWSVRSVEYEENDQPILLADRSAASAGPLE